MTKTYPLAPALEDLNTQVDVLWIDEIEWLLTIAELNWTGWLYYRDGNC